MTPIPPNLILLLGLVALLLTAVAARLLGTGRTERGASTALAGVILAALALTLHLWNLVALA